MSIGVMMDQKLGSEGRVEETVMILDTKLKNVMLFYPKGDAPTIPEVRFVYTQADLNEISILASRSSQRHQPPKVYVYPETEKGKSGYGLVGRIRLSPVTHQDLLFFMTSQEANNLMKEFPAPQFSLEVRSSCLYIQSDAKKLFTSVAEAGKFSFQVGFMVAHSYVPAWRKELTQLEKEKPKL